MVSRILPPGLALLLLTSPVSSIHAEERERHSRLSDHLEIPPTMVAMLGDPRVRISAKEGGPVPPRVEVSGPSSPCRLSENDRRKQRRIGSQLQGSGELETISIASGEPRQVDGDALREVLAQVVLEEAWQRVFADREFDLEAIRMDRDRFFRIGRAHLLGDPGELSDIELAWWRVRMGLPQEARGEHHLLTVVASNAEGGSAYGHFALGLRHREGRPGTDLVIDPRAPWWKKEPPSIKDLGPGSEKMIAGIHGRNLYDWLYTQTHFRGQDLSIRMNDLSPEQALLLRAYGERHDLSELAPFRGFRFNCATLGEQVLLGLLPIEETVCRPHPIADLPERLARKAERSFPPTRVFQLPAQERAGPRERTADWTTQRAPDRVRTAEFLEIRRQVSSPRESL